MKTTPKNTLTFSTFNEQMVRRAFGIRQELKENLLEEWEKRAVAIQINDEEQKLLNKLQAKLNLFVRGWNEEELKIKFIGHLVELVNFDDYELEVAAFSERPLGILYKKTEIKGFVDLMVAKGISQPEQPFFFIHEYKREKDNAGDPVGQLLATMFVARERNKQPQSLSLFDQPQKSKINLPLYGVYVLGRFWFFAILKENRYFVAKSLDSTDEQDLKQIFKMLKAQKEMIMEWVKAVK